MTVQQLIDQLMKVEDKGKVVLIEIDYSKIVVAKEITECDYGVVIE